MNIVITGGMGFIGRALIGKMTDLACECDKPTNFFSIDNLSGNNIDHAYMYESLWNKKIDILTSDIDNLFENADIVVHLAGQIENNGVDRSLFIRQNLDMTVKVLDACRKHKVKKMIFASSAAVYGAYQKPCDVKDRLRPTTIYGTTKNIAEKLIFSSGVPFCIGRFFNVYGPGQLVGVNAVFNAAAKDDTIKVYGDPIRDFIHVSRVVDFIMTAIKFENYTGIYNVCSGMPVRIKDLAESHAKIKGCRIEYLPAREEPQYSVGIPNY